MATYADKYVQALVAQNDAKNAQRRADIQAQYDAWEKQQRAAQRAAQQATQQIPVLQETTPTTPATTTSYSASAPYANEEAAQKAQTARKIENDLGNLYTYSRVLSAQKAAQKQAEEQRKAQEEADRQQRLQAQRQAKKQAEKQKQTQVVMDENGMADVESMKRNARATTQQRQADYAQKQIDKENYPKAQYTEDGKLDVKALQKDARVQQMQNTQTIQNASSTDELIDYYTDKWLTPGYKMTQQDEAMLNNLIKWYQSEHRDDKDLTSTFGKIRFGDGFSVKARTDPEKYPEVQKLVKAKEKTSLLESIASGVKNKAQWIPNLVIKASEKAGIDGVDTMNKSMEDLNKDISNAYTQHPRATNAGYQAANLYEQWALRELYGRVVPKIPGLGKFLEPKNLGDVYNQTHNLGSVAGAFGGNVAKQMLPDIFFDTAPEAYSNYKQGMSAEEIKQEAIANLAFNAAINAGFEIPGLVKTTGTAIKDLKDLNVDFENARNIKALNAIRNANENKPIEYLENAAKASDELNVKNAIEEVPTKQVVDNVADDVKKVADEVPTRQIVDEAETAAKDAVTRETVQNITENATKQELEEEVRSLAHGALDKNPVTKEMSSIGNAIERRLSELYNPPKEIVDAINADAALKADYENAIVKYVNEFDNANKGLENTLKSASNDLSDILERAAKSAGVEYDAKKTINEVYELLMHNEMPQTFKSASVEQMNPLWDRLDDMAKSNVEYAPQAIRNSIEDALYKNMDAIQNSDTLKAKVTDVENAYDKWVEAIYSGVGDLDRLGKDVRNAINRLNTAFEKEGLSKISVADWSLYGKPNYEYGKVTPEDYIPPTQPTRRSVAEDISDEASMTINPNEVKQATAQNAPDWTKNLGENQGISRVITNRSEDVITKEMLENDPIIHDLAKYEKTHEIDTLAKAIDNATTHGQEWLSDVLAGRRAIDNAVDVDTGIIMARRLLKEAKQAQGTERFKELMDQYYGVLSKVREGGTNLGEGVQAFAKWNNTAEGAFLTADKVSSDITKEWVSQNQNAHAGNKRIAKALENMGNKLQAKEAKALTHEEIKEGVRAEFEKEFAGIKGQFNDNDWEILTIFAENKDIPIWKITDEIEHRLKTGEWYSLDESLPVVVEKSKRLQNMLDEVVNGPVKKEQKPEEIGELLTKIRNTVDDESSGVAGMFDDDDVYFIEKMFEQKIPKDQFVDELAHKLETGEWKPLDFYQTNKKLEKALNSLIEGEVRKTKEAKPEISIEQLRKEIKNTLEKEPAGTFKDLTDDDVKYLSNLIKNGATQEELVKALDNRLATGNFGISNETLTKVNELFDYAEQFDVNSKQFVEAQVKAFKLLANEMLPKATPFEKFNAWRYIAMLGNPKTMLRNAVGNATFDLVTGISNNVAALGEILVDYPMKALNHGKGIQRTKTFINPIKDASLISSSAKDLDNSMYRFAKGSKYKEMNKDVLRDAKDTFDTKAMQGLQDLVDKGISDYPFVKAKYSTSLAGYLKANGYDKSIFEADAELKRLRKLAQNQVLTKEETEKLARLADETQILDKARKYALKEAEYATFHEDNVVAKLLSEFSRKALESKGPGKYLGYMMEGVLPFKKTPANILKSGYEFSPLGLISTIKKAGKLTWENTGARKSNLADVYKKGGKDVEKTLAADVIESFSKNLTGSGIMLLGYYLYNKGILKSSDEKTKYQDQLEGIQNYALEIDGKTYTIDWAAPAVMPLLMGAEIAKVWPETGKPTKDFYEHFNDYVNAAGRIANPLIETSFLSGLRDTVTDTANAVRNQDGADILASLAATSGTSYVTQAIPTLSGQIARTIDNTRRDTYTDKTGAFDAVERNLNRVQNKIPFLSKLNQPYIDTYGNEQNNSPWDNPLANFAYQTLSPSYVQEVRTSDADRMSRDVYENSEKQSTNLLPKYQSKAEIDGKKVSPEDYTKYKREYGQANYNIRDGLANNAWFNSLSYAEKEKILGDVNNISNKVGKSSIDPTFRDDDKAYNAYKTGGVNSLIDYYRDKKARDKYNISDNSTAAEAVNASSNPEKVAADMSTISMELKRRGLMKSTDNVPPKEVVEIYNKNGMAGVNDYMMLNTNQKGGSYAGYEKLKTAIPVLTAKEYADIYNTYSVLTSGGNYDNNFAKDTELVPYLTSRSWDSDAQINAVAKALNSSLDGTWSTNGNYLYYRKPSGKVDTYRFN